MDDIDAIVEAFQKWQNSISNEQWDKLVENPLFEEFSDLIMDQIVFEV